MRWGEGDAQFVRPVHGVILLHGGKVVPGTVLGLRSGNKTLGHRFLSRGAITIPNADKYAATLRSRGKVVASFEDRYRTIEQGLRQAVARDEHVLPAGTGATSDILARNLDLISEVAALVEWPKVYAGHFDAEFLAVPPECLALSMQSHQRYFPVVKRNDPGALIDKFLIVSNNEIRDARSIIHGNERVLRARLSDARFFYEQDSKRKLDDLNVRLDHVVYHNRLGSQWDRVDRIRAIANQIAERLGLDAKRRAMVERAATLAKLDLVTDMVGEFPELQGVMGSYYALRQDEDPAVATAIREHYLPRFSGDTLPGTDVGACVALADKIESLVGIIGVGQAPGGDRDPFALRRAALGTLRILVEQDRPLDVASLLEFAASQFRAGLLTDNAAQDVYAFVLDRLRPYLRDQDFSADEIEAVLSLRPARMDDAVTRVRAVHAFRALPAAESLAAANKRIRNILKQAGGATNGAFDPGLSAQDEERALGERIAAIRSEVEGSFAKADYEGGLKKLAGLRPAVDAFFDKVLVMHDDEAIRRNRLALLAGLSNLFLGVADISRLQS